MAAVKLEVEWEYDKVHTLAQHTSSGTILTKGSRSVIKVAAATHDQPTTARPTLRRAQGWASLQASSLAIFFAGEAI